MTRPNVLSICFDDLNDWVGCIGGHPRVSTPHIDRLAARGVLFANAHCQAPICNPSRASLFTGLRPTTTGIYALKPGLRDSEATHDCVTLSQHFQQHGYATASRGKVHHDEAVPPELEKEEFQDWGDINQPLLPPCKLTAPPSDNPWIDWGVFPDDDRKQSDWKTADAAIDFLYQHPRATPFFLAAGFRLPHVPCYITQAWLDRVPDDDSILPPIDDAERLGIPPFAWKLHWNLPEPRLKWMRENHEWRPFVRTYLASIAFIDSQVGRLLDALDELALTDSTVVVLWSDHGYHLGEKGITGKNSLWEPSTHVPLIFAGPGVADGQVCRQPAELLDVYPTLTDLCGLPARDGLEGHSLLPQIRDVTTPRPWPAITTHNPGNHAIRSARWRYIRYADGSEELYDMDQDPHEHHNLATLPESRPVIEEHMRWLPSPEAAPAPGSAVRFLECRDGKWFWEGREILPGTDSP